MNKRSAKSEVRPAPLTPSRSVRDVLASSGTALDSQSRSFFEPRFGRDFSQVRVHADEAGARSARDLQAAAFTAGSHIAFAPGRFAPGTTEGKQLLAHELAHVVQQGGRSSGSMPALDRSSASSAHEGAADAAADHVMRGMPVPDLQQSGAPGLQRKVEMRDVGRGEQSGFARLQELIDRLNGMSGGLTYSMSGSNLAYETRDAAALSNFDQQMMGFIDQEPVLPLRLTNRHGLLGDRVNGFNDRVEADAWQSGYVDIDDLLASTDLGMQLLLVHFIRERAATTNYARRIGSPSMSGPAADREFDRAHQLGIDSEVQLLRAFFGDPTIRFVSEGGGVIFRVYRNARGDIFRARMRPLSGGVDATSVEVVTPDRVVHTPEEYLRLLEQERVRRQVERERLNGGDEHRAGGRGVPAP